MTVIAVNDARSPLAQRIAGLMILGFAVLALVVGVYREIRAGALVAPEAEAAQGVVVRYLHGDKRCSTCEEIEARTEALLRSAFAPEIEDRKLTFVATNYDRPENRHYLADYDLAFGSVVVEARDGGFVKVDEVWDFVMEDSDAMERCLERKIRAVLETEP